MAALLYLITFYYERSYITSFRGAMHSLRTCIKLKQVDSTLLVNNSTCPNRHLVIFLSERVRHIRLRTGLMTRQTACGNWRCTHCGHTGHITGLGFRKSAGFGHSFVEIRGIYPSEAVPGEALLNALKSLTHDDWSTLYIKE